MRTIKAPDGAESTFGYNGLGERVSTTDPYGKTATTAYDLAGRVTRMTDPLGLGTKVGYDQAGRATTTSWLGTTGDVLRSMSTAYDPAGNVVSRTNPLGVTVTRQVDVLGRTVSETEPVSASASITTSAGYDAAGNLTRYTDGNGNTTITAHNPWNLPETVIEPSTTAHTAASSRTWTTSYDAMGRPTRLAQPGSVFRHRTYDALGNLVKETGSGTVAVTPDRVLGYDRAGRVTSANAGAGVNTYSYDDRGNLLSMAGPSGNATYGYDDNSRLTSRTDASGTTAYAYDRAGRLAAATDPLTGAAATYGYDAGSRLTSIGYGAGNGTRSYDYDQLNRLISDVLKDSAGGTTASIGYGYDNADRLTTKTTTGLAGATSNTYAYDRAGRLINWDNATGNTSTNPVAYTWDNNGNRLSAGAVTATYDQRNRLLSSGASTFDYNARGTLKSTTTGDVTVTSQFDAFDRLTVDGNRNYAYDGLDRRIGEGFAYADMSNSLAADGAGKYSRLPNGGLFGLTQGTANGLAYTDRHNDLVGTYSPTGSLTGSTAYDPHGAVTARTGTTSNLGFQSGWTDPTTGKVNMAARWYRPTTGTFASRDSISGPSGPGAAGHNRYLHGLGNPLSYTDPTGHWGHCVGAVALGPAAPPVAAACVAGTSIALLAGLIIGTGAAVSGDSAPAPAPTPINWNGRPDLPRDVPSCASIGCSRPPSPRPEPNTPRNPPTDCRRTGTCEKPKCTGTKCAKPRLPIPAGGDDLREAAQNAVEVTKKALTPLVKPPSGLTIAPNIQELIDDAGLVIAEIMSGQTQTQTVLDGAGGPIPVPEPSPGAETAYLSDACATGGHKRPDNSRTAQIWTCGGSGEDNNPDLVFYTVQGKKNQQRLASGGEPWPTEFHSAVLGVGFYAWGDRRDAEKYRDRLYERFGDPEIQIIEARISANEYARLNVLDMRALAGHQVDTWMDEHSLYGDGTPHGYDHVIRRTTMGVEYYFSTETFRRFKL